MASRRPEKPIPEPGQSWGLFGGAFDPIHLGHLALARDVMTTRALNGVMFVPSARPPHRETSPHASFEDRASMVRLAIEHDTEFSCSTIELERQLSGYTLDTILALKDAYRDVTWYLIVGADHARTFDTWHSPQSILSEATLLIGSRPGYGEELPNSLSGNPHVIVVPSRMVDISATDIRRRTAGGAGVDQLKELVPPSVARYIVQHHLYAR